MSFQGKVKQGSTFSFSTELRVLARSFFSGQDFVCSSSLFVSNERHVEQTKLKLELIEQTGNGSSQVSLQKQNFQGVNFKTSGKTQAANERVSLYIFPWRPTLSGQFKFSNEERKGKQPETCWDPAPFEWLPEWKFG